MAWKKLLSLLGLVPPLVVVLAAWAAEPVLIEDWATQVSGTTGIPIGWRGQSWGRPWYDLVIVADGGRNILHLKSENESATISKALAGSVRLSDTPILEWQWKATLLPAGGDARQRARSDQAAQLYVAWPRFPQAVRSRIIGYIWDTTAPVGLRVQSPKMGVVTYIVVRSGAAELGQWRTERRNVWDDYRALFGEDPEDPGFVALSIDSNDTGSSAEAFIGPILFRAP